MEYGCELTEKSKVPETWDIIWLPDVSKSAE